MDESPPAPRPAAHPADQPPARRRKPYRPPAIVSEARLEARAGSPIPPGGLLDPINTPNDYGL